MLTPLRRRYLAVLNALTTISGKHGSLQMASHISILANTPTTKPRGSRSNMPNLRLGERGGNSMDRLKLEDVDVVIGRAINACIVDCNHDTCHCELVRDLA